MGQVLNFLDDDESFGCLSKAYQSVRLMEKDFLQCDEDHILKPKFLLSSVPSLLHVKNNSIVDPPTILAPLDPYKCGCSTSRLSASTSYRGICTCRCTCSKDVRVKHFVPNPNPVDGERDGFVKGGGAKYIVTDDLSVSSKSSFSSLAYFNMMGVVAMNELEEKVVTVNVEKCKKLLKLALTSKHMVLTKLFKDELGF